MEEKIKYNNNVGGVMVSSENGNIVISSDSSDGGMFMGKSHAEDGGIKVQNKETGEPILVEGGESIINKRSMASQDEVICIGNPRQVASNINQIGDGVKFAEGGACYRKEDLPEDLWEKLSGFDRKQEYNEMSVSSDRNHISVYADGGILKMIRSAFGQTKEMPEKKDKEVKLNIKKYQREIEKTRDDYRNEFKESGEFDNQAYLDDIEKITEKYQDDLVYAVENDIYVPVINILVTQELNEVLDKAKKSLSLEDIKRIETILKSDDLSTDNELIEFLIDDVGLNKGQAKAWVGKRNVYLTNPFYTEAYKYGMEKPKYETFFEKNRDKQFEIFSSDMNYPRWQGNLSDIKSYLEESKELIEGYDPNDVEGNLKKLNLNYRIYDLENERRLDKIIAEIEEKQSLMFNKGGSITDSRRKIKGVNFDEQISNNRKFKELITKAYNNQPQDDVMPIEFLQEIALSKNAIVSHNGNNYIKGYLYKGSLTNFLFLDDPNFIEALKYVEGRTIRKFEDGGMSTDEKSQKTPTLELIDKDEDSETWVSLVEPYIEMRVDYEGMEKSHPVDYWDYSTDSPRTREQSYESMVGTGYELIEIRDEGGDLIENPSEQTSKEANDYAEFLFNKYFKDSVMGETRAIYGDTGFIKQAECGCEIHDKQYSNGGRVDEFNAFELPITYEVVNKDGDVILKTQSFNKAVDTRTTKSWEEKGKLKIIATDKNGNSKVIAEGIDEKGNEYSNGGGVGNDYIKEKYDELSNILEKNKIPCKIKLTDRDIIVELGFNYPDRLADKVFDAFESIGLTSNLVNVCAESSGDTILESKRIMGGPKRYFNNGGSVDTKYKIAKKYFDDLYSNMNANQKAIYNKEYTRLAKYFEEDESSSFNDREVAEYIQGTINELVDSSYQLQAHSITIPFFKLGHKYIAYWNAYKQPEWWDGIEFANGGSVGGYEIVVVAKGLEKDGGQIIKDRFYINSNSITDAKNIAKGMWEKEMYNSDFHIIDILTDVEYRTKYLSKEYTNGGSLDEKKRIDDILNRRVEINKYLNQKYGSSRGKNKSEKEEIEALRKEYNLLGEEYHQLNKEYSNGGGVGEDKLELFYVMDNNGNVKNISKSYEKANDFLEKFLKFNGKIGYKNVPKSDWYAEKINVSNIKTYSNGGGIGLKERSERDSIKLAKAYQKVLDSNFADEEYKNYKEIVKETQIPKDELQKIEHYIATTPKGQQRMIDIYRYWGTQYAVGGTIATGRNARGFMAMESKIWDKLNIESGSQLYADTELQKKYAEMIFNEMNKKGFKEISISVYDILEDNNYHSLNSAFTYMGYYGKEKMMDRLEKNKATEKIGLSLYGLSPDIFTIYANKI